MLRLFLLCFSFWLAGCQVLSLPDRRQPLLKNGHIDLQNWNFDQQGNISLHGEWLFYPLAFIDPAQAKVAPSQWQLSRIPGSPNTSPLYEQDASIGYGTYMMSMTLPQSQAEMSLRLWMVQSAYVLYGLDDESGLIIELARSGQVGKSRQETIGELSEKVIPLPLSLLRHQKISLILHISSFYNSVGIMSFPRLGLSQAIYSEEIFKQMERALVMGGFSVIALYGLALFLGRRRSQLDLLSVIFTLLLLLRYSATEWLMYWFFHLTRWIEPLGLFLNYWSTHMTIVVLLVIFSRIQPLPFLLRLKQFSIGFNLLMILTWWVMGFDWIVANVIGLCFFVLLSSGLSLFFAILYLRWKKTQDMDLTVWGFSALTIAGLNDYLVFFHQVPNIFLIQYAILFFAFTQSLITGRMFARTYQRNEELLLEISEKERARTLFFHNTSHELRTPLNGIIGFLQLLSDNRYGEQTAQSKQQLLKCIRLAESLKNQVNTILDLAKSKKGKLTLDNSLISLDDIFSEVCNLAEGLLLKRVDSRFEAERFWGDQDANFIGDREKLTTIFRNLLGNAFKFADPHRSNYVKMKIKREKEAIVLTISDTGIGIPKDHLEGIFEEFRQVAGDTRRNYEGTGLGLSMVRDLVNLMHGSIEVESEPGRGSVFRVRIPEQSKVHSQARQQRPSPFADQSHDSSIAALSRLNRAIEVRQEGQLQQRILVVDDNEINCEVIEHMLEEQGYEVIVAFGGQEALVKMRTEIPDLVLLDMMMPQVSGEDVLRAMKADSLLLDIPVILITARASDDDRMFGLGLGADDYLAKPIHQVELNMRVRNLLYRLEVNRRMVQLEERDRLAQLGELLGELSHELKNIFQFSDLNQRIDRRMLSTLIQCLPIATKAWPKAAEILAEGELSDSGEGGADGLSFLSLKQSEDPVLRSLRMRLAHLTIPQEDKHEIWVKIQELPEADRMLCDNQLILVRSFVLLRDQSRYARELIMDILEFNRTQEGDVSCEVVKTIDAVLKLCRPRLMRQKIRVELSLTRATVQMSAGGLMQVLLNILSNASDALRQLPSGERWLKIQTDIFQEKLVISVSNAGELIPEAHAKQIFERGFSSKGPQGSGLGLSLVWRLLQRVHGTIELDQSAGTPCFKVILVQKKSREVVHHETT